MGLKIVLKIKGYPYTIFVIISQTSDFIYITLYFYKYSMGNLFLKPDKMVTAK